MSYCPLMLYCAGILAGPPLVGAAIDSWNPHGFAVMMALLPATYLPVAAVTWTSSNTAHRSA